MRVLHGIWAGDALCLWAEDSVLPTRGDAQLQPQPQPQTHPFACPPAELADLLEPAGDIARKAVEAEVTLWLPTVKRAPMPSPELDPEPRPGKPSLARWRVPALAFEPAAALELLAVLDTGVGPAGASIPYLAAVARFAEGLARRGRVLPTLVREDAGYAARWHPVLAGSDAQRARDLADAMPPICRAVGVPMAPTARSSGIDGANDTQGASGSGVSGVSGVAGVATVAAVAALAGLTDAAARRRLPASLLPVRRGRTPARIPLAERFVVSLTSPDARLKGLTPRDEAEAAELAAELDAWLDGARMPAGPVRTCFRLTEPVPGEPVPGEPVPGELVPGELVPGGTALAADGNPWLVEFALQSTEDPSLMIPAADVWAGSATMGSASLGSASLGSGDPVEQLLAGLGGAARLFPELGAALREAAPHRLALDTAGAFRFLKQTGSLLAGAGFGVLLPDWVRKARLGLKLTTRTNSASTATAAVTAAKFGLKDLVEFRYDLAVGDEALDAGELAELARLKIPLVRLRGQWVELDDAHLAAALKFLERNPPGTATAADLLTAALHGPDDAGPLAAVPLVAFDGDGWLGDLLSGQADRRLAPVALGDLLAAGFTGTLRPYQERGLAWLSFLGELGLGGVLADDMGLGKTIQLLSLVAFCAERPTLLICPMSVVGNWQREAATFTPDLRVHVHHGSDRLDGEELTAALAGADLVITTYGVATRDRAKLSEVRWARVVCDEAQNIKNHATRQAQAIRALPAATRIALTGTPVENRLGELWSILEFTNPGLLGSAEKFRRKYAIPIERHADAGAVESLKRLTGPFILRRLKTDRTIISDLPDKQEMKVWCNLTAEQASLYQATVEDMLSQIEAAEAESGEQSMSRRGLVLATMAKLKQVCNHPAHLLGDGSRLPGRSGKLVRLEEICDEITAAGDKALLFTQYAEFGRMLQPHLAARLGCPVLFLHGGTTKKQRDAMVESFTALDEPALFLLSLKAGGTGLNLTAASHVIHVDRWWNPAVEDQATDRAFRIGQRRNVQVRKFVCVGTLEERIDAMIEEKKALASSIVGTGESWLTELSVADLRAVLELSPEAVSE
jgi:superfamily II DNA or RNA helicase